MSDNEDRMLRRPPLNYDEELLGAMADPSRKRILQTLCTPGAGRMQALSVSEIAEESRISLSTVSHHLQILRRSGLVSVERAGRQRLYRLELERLTASLVQFRDLLGLIDAAMQRARRRAARESEA